MISPFFTAKTLKLSVNGSNWVTLKNWMGLIPKITVTIICMGPFVAIFRHTQMMLLSNIRNPIINRPQNHQKWLVLCLPSPNGSCLWHWLNPKFDAHLPNFGWRRKSQGRDSRWGVQAAQGDSVVILNYKTVLQGVVMLKKWLSLYSFYFMSSFFWVDFLEYKASRIWIILVDDHQDQPQRVHTSGTTPGRRVMEAPSFHSIHQPRQGSEGNAGGHQL